MRGTDRLRDLQQHAQAAGAARQLRFGEAHAALHRGGDFLVRIAFAVVQPEHAAGGRGQLAQCALQQRAIGGGGRRRGMVFGQVVRPDAIEFGRQPSLAPQALQGFVHRDLAQPAPERAAAIAAESIDRRPQLQHRLLQDLVRLAATAAHAQRQGEHRPFEPAIQLLERRQVPGAHAGEQGGGDVDREARSGGHLLLWMPGHGKGSQPP